MSVILSGMRNTEDWLTKADVCKVLQCSEKHVERMVKRGRLQRSERKVDGARAVAIYHPRDVEKLRAETEAQGQPGAFLLEAGDGDKAAVSGLPALAGGPGGLLALAPSFAGVLDGLPAMLAALAGGIDTGLASKKLWLTLPEAVAYSGLPKSTLMQAGRGGKLPMFRTGRGWRIRKTDLEGLDLLGV